jgi:hypothetical protein
MGDGSDQQVDALRGLIRSTFPAEPFFGKVTPHDGAWTDEFDEELALYEALHGQRWTEVPTQVLAALSTGLPLLTGDAFVSFLPACLMGSLEEMNVESEVREFLIYSFSSTLRQFDCLSPAQRTTVRSLLVEFSKHERSEFLRVEAIKAVDPIDWASSRSTPGRAEEITG